MFLASDTAMRSGALRCEASGIQSVDGGQAGQFYTYAALVDERRWLTPIQRTTD